MAKDPAFLFYPGDWMGGTQWMTFEQKGCYIELLILQFNCYQFTEAQAKQVLSICFDLAWPMLKQKFKSDGEFYYNERLRIEIEKRKNYTESRRINALTPKKEDIKKEASAKHMTKHMENENEIENIIEYLNKKTNKNFSSKTKNSIKHINSRLNEAFKFDDFKLVIDFKVEKWINDPNMNEYLRPDTLFGTKFESYLNAAKNKLTPVTQTKPKFTVTAKNGTRMVFYVDTLDEAKKLYAKETGAMIEDIYDVYARN